MTRVPAFILFLAVALPVTNVMAADEPSWDGQLAEKYSGRFKEIQRQLAELSPQLEHLPDIPIDDQGGTGGYASNYQSATSGDGPPFAVEIRWQEATPVDLIALVPARRYDAKGLDSQYGLPSAFSVDLIDEKGNVVSRVAAEKDAGQNPVRKGHPFVYQVSPPVLAAGLRISADRLDPSYDEKEEVFVQAWAEAMVFQGTRNIALGAEAKSIAGTSPPAAWNWDPSFIVDGKTPLGLPEIPTPGHSEIGWMSEARPNANQSASLNVDLGEPVEVDAIILVPAKKPTSDLPSGFGFPRHLEISASDTAQPGTWTTVAEREMANPGHNPVWISLNPVSARYFRIEATQLWKAIEDYPAFFALSEVEVLSNERNLALGKRVQSPDGMMNLIALGGRTWNSASLSDGFGPEGKLVSTRDWILRLDKRLQIESRRYQLQVEASALVNSWRQAARIAFIVLGLAAAFLIVILPIRYRIKANRELTRVRERIAGDLHDEVGSNLGSIQMFADLAEGRSGPSDELKRIQRIAAETVSAVRDIVWLLRPTGDHQIGTVEHLRETASIMLESLKWKFTANEDAWLVELSEAANRDLFLFFREALHNIMRHSHAGSVDIRAEKTAVGFSLVIVDDGTGIPAERMERPATLRALHQRTESLRGSLDVETKPDAGTRLHLTIPLDRKWKTTSPAVG